MMLEEEGKKCSRQELNLVATILEQHSNDISELGGCRRNIGQGSSGFYILYLGLKRYDADPKPFFRILEVDRKIGWTNPTHVEYLVFYYKAIKIIEEEEVSLRISFILRADQTTFPVF